MLGEVPILLLAGQLMNPVDLLGSLVSVSGCENGLWEDWGILWGSLFYTVLKIWGPRQSGCQAGLQGVT